MKHPPSTQNTARTAAYKARSEASPGPNGLAIAPPAYGIDVIDSIASEAMPAQGQEHQARQPARQLAPSVLHSNILTMQQSAGSRAVNRLLDGTLGQPLEPATRQFMEARFRSTHTDAASAPGIDRPAAGAIPPQRYVRNSYIQEFAGHGPVLQRACACGGSPGPNGECAECRQKRLDRQRAAAEGAAAQEIPPIVHEVLRSPGQPLDAATRTFMEQHFGQDFSGVRVHTDAQAADSARAVNALAYTVGNHVAFGARQYQPHHSDGKRLLAHELAHVVQQHIGSTPAAPLRMTEPDHPSEQAAARSAYAIDCDPKSSVGSQPTSEIALARQQAATGTPVQSQNPPRILQEIPIVFVAEPFAATGRSPATTSGTEAGISPSGYAISGGMSLHVLASGDLSWLPRMDAAQRVMSPQYWSPFLPSRGTITLDRLLDELPRDLAPRIQTELASGQPLSWMRGAGSTGVTFTDAELRSLPQLARRLNAGGTLSQAEISLLARATEIHVGGSTPGAPFASYTRPNFEIPFNRQYRVRVEIPRGNVLDVSQPNVITSRWINNTPNVDEMEFMAVADNEGRIVSVQRAAGSPRASALMRYSGAIRWGGRIVFVAGLGLSAHRVATAPQGERLNVAAEEGGSMAGGAAGTALAVAGCVAFGIATGGVGLFICGLVGGAIGSTIGSGAAGTMMRGLQEGGTSCPSCHALQREWEARRSLRGFERMPSQMTGAGFSELLSADGRAPGTRGLTPQELDVIRRWLQDTSRQH